MKTVPCLLLAAILCCVFAAPPASAGKRQYDLPETGEPLPNSKTLPNEEQVLQFLEWERATEQRDGIRFNDLRNGYARSAAYAAVYGECLATDDPRMAGEHAAMARSLLAATARLTDRQTAERQVDREYRKIKHLVQGCAYLRHLEGNYDALYFTRILAIEKLFSFDAWARRNPLPDTPQQTDPPRNGTSPQDGASPRNEALLLPLPKGWKGNFPELNDDHPNGIRILQFLEWEEQQATTWDIDVKKAYAKSAAYGMAYATCLREHKYLKAGESMLVANILLAATAYLTDRQIATLAVDNEYEDVQRITQNCARLTNLEGNYDLVYFAKLTELKTFVSTWAEDEQDANYFKSTVVIVHIVLLLIWFLMDKYNRRK